MTATTTSSASAEQIQLLFEFMAKHTDLARNRLQRSIEGRNLAKNLLAEITNNLNAVGGAFKTTKQWQKLWADRKYLAKKAASVANQAASATGGGPSNVPIMSEQDHHVLNIMGENFGLPDTGSFSDPFPKPNNEIQQEATVSEMAEDMPVIVDVLQPFQQEFLSIAGRSVSPILPSRQTSRRPSREVRVTAGPAVRTNASIPSAERGRRRRYRPPRTPRPQALPEDVRTRLFRIEEEKKEEMARIRLQLEKLTDTISAAVLVWRRLNNNNHEQ